MLAYVPRARTRGHLFPRNPLHPTTIARGERGESFLCLTLQELSPLLISSASCSTALVPAKDPTLQYVFIQGIRRQKRTSGIGREHRAGVSSECGVYEREYTRKDLHLQKEKGGVHGTRSVIFAEVATPASV
ncbi:unnamed protein product [Lasius platythorax]|uniref:Uncharacterized protein n=1 Tax=Lasius platythorax TaxID=488582 RepID=A0AAV2NI09_9HYME